MAEHHWANRVMKSMSQTDSLVFYTLSKLLQKAGFSGDSMLHQTNTQLPHSINKPPNICFLYTVHTRTLVMAGHLVKRLHEYTVSLMNEGVLNEQFNQLKSLQDESDPDFIVEVLSLFFDDSVRLLNELALALDEQVVDFKKVDALVHQFKGSSSSVGAQRVQAACMSFRWYCKEENIEECLKCLQVLRSEYSAVKSKLEILLKLEQQILAAGRMK